MKSTRATSTTTRITASTTASITAGTTTRILAFCLAFLLVATSLPATATIAAEGAPTGGTVVSIATATDLITVDQGTAQESLGLPETLAATAILTGDTSNTAVDVTLPVTWASDPAYDANQPGEYLFTGALDSEWVLDIGVVMPEIRVAVRDAGDADLDPNDIMTLDMGMRAAPGGSYNTDTWALTLTNITPGTLEATARKLVPHGNTAFCVFDLTVSGTSLNEADFKFMRGMTRCGSFDLSRLTSQTVIPDNGLELVAAYSKCLTTVKLPASVRKIGKKAFAQNSSLKNINLGNVTEIGEEAFFGCSGLTLSKIGTGPVELESRAFQYCQSLGEMDLSNITYFGEGAFAACSNLKVKNGKLNRAVTVLEDDLFLSCSSMNQLDISNIIAIGNRSLARTALGEINLSRVISIGEQAFSNNGNMTLTGGILNSRITEIPKGAFEYCGNLSAINLSNVTTVGESAFDYCSKLTNLTSTAKLTTIGNSAFTACTSLGEIDLSKVTAIGNGAFVRCSKLTIKSGEKLGAYGVTLGSRAFNGCTALNLSTTDLSNVSRFGGQVFFGNSYSYERYNVTLKPGTKLGAPGCVIDDSAFSGLAEIKNLDLSNVASIGKQAFYRNSIYLTEGSTIGAPGVTLGERAFEDAQILTQNTNFSNVQTFGRDVFKNGRIPSVKPNTKFGAPGAKIESSAFYRCSGIGKIDLSNAAQIGHQAFEGTDVNFVKNTTVGQPGVQIDSAAFRSCRSIGLTDLSNASYIGSEAFKDCKTMWIKGGAPLGAPGAKISNLAFAGNFSSGSEADIVDLSNVVSFGERAFEGCTNLTLEEGKPLGKSGAIIYRYAFSGCTGLGEMDMSNVASIYSNAFQNCSNMKIIDAEFSPFTIQGDSVFENCAKLGEVVLQQDVWSLGASVFAGCKNLSVRLDSQRVVSIRDTTFTKTSKVTVYVPEALLSDYENNSTWEYAIERQKVELLGYTLDGGIIKPPPINPDDDDDKDENDNNNHSYGGGGGGATLGSAGTPQDKPAEKPADKPVEKPEPIPPATLPGTSPQEKKELLSFTIGADNYVYDGKTTAANANLGSAYLDSEGNAMLPLRAIAELMGYAVDWSPEAKQITIALPDGKRVTLYVGASEIYQNGRIIGQLTDASGKTITPTIKDGRAYLPVRAFFVEVLGMNAADVIYDIETQSIKIVTTQPQGGTV